MLSFLPKKYKQTILLEYRLRALSAIFMFVSLAAVVGLVGLLPTYLNEKAQADALRPSLDENMTEEEQAREARRNNNKVYAEYLFKESKALSGQNLYTILSSLIADKPVSVSVRSIVFGSKTVAVSGIAATRNDLIDFQRALQSNALFTEVSLPISDITKNVDAPFTIELTLK